MQLLWELNTEHLEWGLALSKLTVTTISAAATITVVTTDASHHKGPQQFLLVPKIEHKPLAKAVRSIPAASSPCQPHVSPALHGGSAPSVLRPLCQPVSHCLPATHLPSPRLSVLSWVPGHRPACPLLPDPDRQGAGRKACRLGDCSPLLPIPVSGAWRKGPSLCLQQLSQHLAVLVLSEPSQQNIWRHHPQASGLTATCLFSVQRAATYTVWLLHPGYMP